MKKILAAILFLILFSVAQNAFASKIPDAELGILKETFSDVNVRFDGMVELSDGTNYIPVYPVNTKKLTEPAKIKQTIPAGKSLKDKPDFIMFNTDLALFKVIPDKDNKKTFIYTSDLPYEVKMGLMPQDLLVPQGFQIPEELKIIIGDLLIPTKPMTGFREVNITEDNPNMPSAKLISQAAEQFANKYFYSTNFKSNSLTILNADTGKAFKKIDFDSIPSDLKLTNNGKYLLLSTISNNRVFIIDTAKTKVLKDINTGEKPFFIAVSEAENKAYIANRGENKISVINITTMQPEQDIEVQGHPCYIATSEDGQKLYYLDSISGMVYYLEKFDNYFQPYSAKTLFRANNISKIQISEDKIYTLDRGNNKLIIFYIDGKPEDAARIIEVSDITPVTPKEVGDSLEVNTVDFNYYNKKGELPDAEVKEKLTFKQKARKAFRALLYFPEDDTKVQNQENPENQIAVYTKEETSAINTALTDEYGVAYEEEPNVTYVKKKTPKKDPNRKKTFKEKWLDFLNYKSVAEPLTPMEVVKLKIDDNIDLINIQSRANDFAVVKDKIYLLCSDDYVVYVYDKNTGAQINSFELEQTGYYNSVKVSTDQSTGILTNISSDTMTIFDTEKDAVIQKLPLSTSVHNVVITGRK